MPISRESGFVFYSFGIPTKPARARARVARTRRIQWREKARGVALEDGSSDLLEILLQRLSFEKSREEDRNDSASRWDVNVRPRRDLFSHDGKSELEMTSLITTRTFLSSQRKDTSGIRSQSGCQLSKALFVHAGRFADIPRNETIDTRNECPRQINDAERRSPHSFDDDQGISRKLTRYRFLVGRSNGNRAYLAVNTST